MSVVGGRADVVCQGLSGPFLATSGNSRSDKTFIGRIEKGFDFLGYHFGPDGLCVAKKTGKFDA